MPLLTPSERIGTSVGGRYQLSAMIGQGASAVLFAGHDRALDRKIAVKVMRPDGALAGNNERERFRREAQTLARLRHPNLVEVFDVGETEDEVPFVVMELLQGESLAEHLERKGRLSTHDALALMLPMMGGLACAHDLGVVHRDVKPANMFLHEGGSRGIVPKLLDFGIAKVEQTASLTGSGLALGTPAYMAPEQARGEDLGPQADVWAMGVTLYRVLSGRLPFEATTAAGVLLQATRSPPSRLTEVDGSIDRGLAFVVERALDPDLKRRHANMRDFARSLVHTAQRAQIHLPRDPDPIGLADFRAWREGAHQEVDTSPQELPFAHTLTNSREGEPYQAREATTSQPVRVRRISRVKSFLLALALLVVALVVARFAALNTAARAERMPTSRGGLAASHRARVLAEQPPTQEAPRDAALSARPSSQGGGLPPSNGGVAETPAAPKKGKPRRVVKEVDTAPAPTAAPTKKPLVRDWEW